jgi:ATPase subunit of ABC transporter with duplicated ATPase domains
MCYGAQLLFDDVTLLLQPGNRYGITGANGAGKSTLLRLIAGEEAASEGTITMPKNARVGYLKQDQFVHDDCRIIDVVIQGRQPLWKALQERDQLLLSKKDDMHTGYRLLELEEIIGGNDGYRAESVARMLLSGLGIREGDHERSLRMLSGGFKLRVLLARALFDNPDVLLLDEPTNYLDIASIAWLESYLMHDFMGLLLFISHDHAFMSRVATSILDVDYGEIRLYHGNYDAFVKEKRAVVERKMNERNYIERKVAKMRVFVEKFRASAARSKQALSREKAVEKIDIPNVEATSRQAPAFMFMQQRPSGEHVLTVKNVMKSFGGVCVLNKITLAVKRGERIALLGKNGMGKSTLLKIITNHLKADAGIHEWGYEAHCAYFPQEQDDIIRSNMTVFAWLSAHTERQSESSLYGALSRMLFDKHDFAKRVTALSGGELARLKFAQIILAKPNVLILDEPTNHLDLESCDALAQALCDYPGTIIAVSHDRYFVQRFAKRIITLHERGIDDFVGTYEEYEATRESRLLGVVKRV